MTHAVNEADEAQNQALLDHVKDIAPPGVFASEIPVDIDPYALSPQWSRGNDFKKPFNYALGHGAIEQHEITQFAGKTQIVKIRRLDMGDLLKLGIAEELDFMTKGLLAEESPKDSPKKAVESVILQAGNYARMEKMINTVVLSGLITPKLYPIPIVRKEDKTTGKVTEEQNDNARQAGLVYIDSVPFSDRMELFSVIFESEGLSTFRSEQAAGVGNVADVTDVSLPAN